MFSFSFGKSSHPDGKQSWQGHRIYITTFSATEWVQGRDGQYLQAIPGKVVTGPKIVMSTRQDQEEYSSCEVNGGHFCYWARPHMRVKPPKESKAEDEYLERYRISSSITG